MSVKNSTYNSKNGRYTLGGTSETSSFAIEWWNKKPLGRDPSDIVYVMEKKYEQKVNLLGHVFYGDVGLWWVIAQYNGITDPISELVEGKVLLIPLKERVEREMFASGVNTGGVPSKRS